MNDKCKKNENLEEQKNLEDLQDLVQELDDDALNAVTGAGSPWETDARVPEQEIPEKKRPSMR